METLNLGAGPNDNTGDDLRAGGAKINANFAEVEAALAALEAYVDSSVTGLLDLKGDTDCSANPNYPVASKGDAYYVTVAGKIGGASGKSVDVGDVYVAKADSAGGTEASVGNSWFVLEHNLILPVSTYILPLFFTTTPAASEVLLLHKAGAAFTIPANFTAALESYIGTNPTATFALTVAQNGVTIGTISVSTGGVVTATTTSGTAKAIAQGDLITITGPGTADTTAANMAFTIIGER